MKKFQTLLESLSVIKKTTVMRYPKQIKLSEEFQTALRKEITRHCSLTESKQVIPNFDEKFLKAIRFQLYEMRAPRVSNAKWRERKLKPILKQLDAIQSVRKDMPPPSKVEEPAKGAAYNRAKEKLRYRQEEEA